MGERAAAPPDPPHPHRGGGGGHHRHGSSNKELARAIAHVADELHDLHDLMENLVEGQQEAYKMESRPGILQSLHLLLQPTTPPSLHPKTTSHPYLLPPKLKTIPPRTP